MVSDSFEQEVSNTTVINRKKEILFEIMVGILSALNLCSVRIKQFFEKGFK
jgi:hypothetical protein